MQPAQELGDSEGVISGSLRPGDLRVLMPSDVSRYMHGRPMFRRKDGSHLPGMWGDFAPTNEEIGTLFLLDRVSDVDGLQGVFFWRMMSRYGIVYTQEANLEATTVPLK